MTALALLVGTAVCYLDRTKRRGFAASHGGTYDDPVTKKARLYDVRALRQQDRFRVDLAIECKSLKRYYPLLLSRIPRTADESFHDLIFSRKRPQDVYSDPLSAPAEARRVKRDSI